MSQAQSTSERLAMPLLIAVTAALGVAEVGNAARGEWDMVGVSSIPVLVVGGLWFLIHRRQH